MEFPLNLYFDAELENIEIQDSSHGECDFRKAYIVDKGQKNYLIYSTKTRKNVKRFILLCRLPVSRLT